MYILIRKQSTKTIWTVLQILPENEHSPVWVNPVTDANGAFPVLSYDESLALSTAIQTFSASDDDLGQDGSLTYTIGSVTAGGPAFYIRSHTVNIMSLTIHSCL